MGIVALLSRIQFQLPGLPAFRGEITEFDGVVILQVFLAGQEGQDLCFILFLG